MTELQELKSYLQSRYPQSFVHLWANEDETKFFGMLGYLCHHVELGSDTLGGLTSQCDNFFRRIES